MTFKGVLHRNGTNKIVLEKSLAPSYEAWGEIKLNLGEISHSTDE